MLNNAVQLLSSNCHLLLIALFGSVVLFGLKCSEHFMKSEQDKLPTKRYIVFFVALLIFLPFLGVGVTAVYIINGDKLSPILALQIGLTSPAIVQSLIIAAANNMAKNNTQTITEGQ
jgi:hypothetical protein